MGTDDPTDIYRYVASKPDAYNDKFYEEIMKVMNIIVEDKWVTLDQ